MHAVSGWARQLVTRVGDRLRSEEQGFTLIEMVNVMLILGILMSISVSAYGTLHARAEQKAAVANVSAVLPAIASWRNDNGTYAGMTMALLNSTYMNNSLDVTYFDVGPTLDTTQYCIQYTVPTGDYTAKVQGPDGSITVGPGNVCT
jgi:prepilin-type N-terminal cleavage/methylation domain-containing protein